MFLSKHQNGFYYLYYTNENGKRKCITTKTKLKSEANKFLSSFSKKLKEEIESETKPIKLRRMIFKFLIYSESVHCYKHTITLKSTFKGLVNYLGEIDAAELTRETILNFIQHRSRRVSPHTVKREIESMSSMFNWAVDHNYLITNFCKGIKRPRLPEKLPLYFTKSDFQKLLDNTKDEDLKDIFIFAVNTGLRQMELLKLEWNQIDLSNSLVHLDNRNHLTKSKKIRSLPLNNVSREILYKRSNNKVSEIIVFTYQGKEMNQQFISHKIKKIVKQTDINQKLNFHSLRHTFASWLVQAGVSIYDVSKLLGHSDIRTTQIYAHLRSDDLKRAVDLL